MTDTQLQIAYGGDTPRSIIGEGADFMANLSSFFEAFLDGFTEVDFLPNCANQGVPPSCSPMKSMSSPGTLIIPCVPTPEKSQGNGE